MTVLLALDSSTETMALALSSPAGRWVFEAEGGPQASARLVPEAQALLASAGLRLADVDAIGFGRGPGAFTGLRAACAVVQGLAFALGKPVLSLCSLELVAEDARQQAEAEGRPLTGVVWVAMDARMNEIYAAALRWDGQQWRVLQAPALYAPASLLAHWERPEAVAGSALLVFAEALAPALEGVRQWPRCQSRAQALASLAAQAFARGELLDAAEAMPVYVRDKVAQTTAERMAAKAAVGSAA
ncbi:tRNA (adenosine(37)-N6)-threonylcarbamoyltransferase complex dimerization subunit type 1 TsaB [Roseateles sp.]|uniref:tRNA (adenosine(37)-N6)-threonylcarbamoyltransferase complex dimerization subunit type 1 TsaB n=1 Tax=Roseateles sp. TaxID=1971397 RepID=UPI003D0A7442